MRPTHEVSLRRTGGGSIGNATPDASCRGDGKGSGISAFSKIAAGSLAVLTALAIALGTGSATAATGCTLVAAPGGSDSAAGTEAAPLQSPAAVLARLKSGQTGCLRAGTYTSRQFLVKTPGVTLMSFPGERATLRGQLRFNVTAVGSTAENLNLDGRNVDNLLGPLIYADAVVLRGNEISNNHTGICVHIDDYSDSPPPRGVVIENNVIRDCGRLPATNHDHGIYIANARDTVVRGNIIYGNADRGIQMYPDADGTTVVNNIIDGNGQGVIFGGGPNSSSDNNLVANNVITGSTIRWNIESHWQGPVGSGNIARNNCTWMQRGSYSGTPEGSGIQSMTGARAVDNVVANPNYLDRSAGDYRMSASSPCRDLIGGETPPLPPVEPPTEEPPTVDPPTEEPPKPTGSKGRPCKTGADGTGRKLLVGGNTNDRLIGGAGSDRLAGRDGADKIVGGRGGPDCLLGGKGLDRVRAVNGHRDVIKCGGGRDRATVERRDRVRDCERVIVRK